MNFVLIDLTCVSGDILCNFKQIVHVFSATHHPYIDSDTDDKCIEFSS